MNNNAAEYAKDVAQGIRDNTPEDIFEYLEDVLEIEYTVNSSGEYLGARIAIELGGPNVWIDTRAGEIVVYWSSDTAREWLPGSFIDRLNDTLEEYFEMAKSAVHNKESSYTAYQAIAASALSSSLPS